MSSEPTSDDPTGAGPGSPAADEIVRKTASLARLDVDDDQVARLAPQFARILKAFRTLARLDVASVAAMTRAGGDQPRTRADQEVPSLSVDAALANAPARVEDFYSVPSVLPSRGKDPE